MSKPVSITIEPAAGGQLRTRLSAERPGHLHYTIKRDWRRDGDREKRREGHDYFYPIVGDPSEADNSGYPIEQAMDYWLGNQPWPQNQPDPPANPLPITLVHEVPSPTGRRAVVVGTETDLYCFYPDANGYPYTDPGDTPDDQYINEWFPNEWTDTGGNTHVPETRPTDGDPTPPTSSGGTETPDGGGTGGGEDEDGGSEPPATPEYIDVPAAQPLFNVQASTTPLPTITPPTGYGIEWVDSRYFWMPPYHNPENDDLLSSENAIYYTAMLVGLWQNIQSHTAAHPGSKLPASGGVYWIADEPGSHLDVIDKAESGVDTARDNHPAQGFTAYYIYPL